MQLDAALKAEPKAVLLTGEDPGMPLEIGRVEPEAHNPDRQNREASTLYALDAAKYAALTSDCGFRLRERIGSNFCNRIYYQTLAWAGKRHSSVAFIRFGPEGDKGAQERGIKQIIDAMISI